MYYTLMDRCYYPPVSYKHSCTNYSHHTSVQYYNSIGILGHSKSISCFSSPLDFRPHVTSTIQKYTASIFGRVELVNLMTISFHTCNFDDHFSPKCHPPASILGLRGDEKQVIDLEWPYLQTVSIIIAIYQCRP